MACIIRSAKRPKKQRDTKPLYFILNGNKTVKELFTIESCCHSQNNQTALCWVSTSNQLCVLLKCCCFWCVLLLETFQLCILSEFFYFSSLSRLKHQPFCNCFQMSQRFMDEDETGHVYLLHTTLLMIQNNSCSGRHCSDYIAVQ